MAKSKEEKPKIKDSQVVKDIIENTKEVIKKNRHVG